MNFIFDIFKGIAIGAGAILPGISSGVLCVIFGIYEKLVNSILGIFKNFKKNFLYLLPFAIGGLIGVVLFGNGLNFLFLHFEVPMKMLFVGLILGSIPGLIKTSTFPFSLHYLIYTIIAFLCGLLMVFVQSNYSNNLLITSEISSVSGNFSSFSIDSNFVYLIICGFCMSLGIVVPRS